MTDDTVVALRQPGDFEDLLTDVLRQGARKLLAQAVEAEVADFLAAHADLTTEDGRQRLVRHGHLPERTVQTGIGPVDVRQPRVRDRGGDGEKIRFSPAILPPYARRSKSLDAQPRALGSRSSICAGSRAVTSKKRSRPCSARTRPICRPPRSAGSKPHGRRNSSAGGSVICQPDITSTSGPTASTCRPGWRSRNNASSS